jgi:hypothetical protein
MTVVPKRIGTQRQSYAGSASDNGATRLVSLSEIFELASLAPKLNLVATRGEQAYCVRRSHASRSAFSYRAISPCAAEGCAGVRRFT